MSNSGRKHMPEPVRRIEVFTGAGRRRTWSMAEKAAIVAESCGGETVCAVARRHGLTPQQLFTWRRLARSATSQPEALFVPAVVETGSEAAAPARPRSSPASAVEIEIGGATVRFGAQASAEVITAVLRALKSAP
jgi:transposase